MGTIQQQLDRILSMFLEEQANNKNRQDEMNAKLEAIARDVSNSNSGPDVEASSQIRPSRNKGISGTSEGSSILPKFSKLDFPKFSGEEDPLAWLQRCEHFFKHQNTPEEEKVTLASYHLMGNAQYWLNELFDENPNPTWEELKQQCNLRFGPPVRSNKLGELAKLKQVGSVADYQTQFEILVPRAGKLTKDQKIQLYISGLKDHIAVEVELHQPTDLATAMSMSRLYEKRTPLPSRFSNRSVTAPIESKGNRSIRRLSPAEMEERRKKNLCFNCDEPFSRGHQCKRLFWIELDDGESDMDTGEESPEISLNAITGTHNAQTMRVMAEWNGKSVLVLIDSGSTHNFVAANIVKQVDPKIEKKDGLRVRVANGEQIFSSGVCRNSELQMGGHPFGIDLFVLPLSGIDVVLGVSWLKTLGPILWDFFIMRMAFSISGTNIEL